MIIMHHHDSRQRLNAYIFSLITRVASSESSCGSYGPSDWASAPEYSAISYIARDIETCR